MRRLPNRRLSLYHSDPLSRYLKTKDFVPLSCSAFSRARCAVCCDPARSTLCSPKCRSGWSARDKPEVERGGPSAAHRAQGQDATGHDGRTQSEAGRVPPRNVLVT
jgi:hypothetical protein